MRYFPWLAAPMILLIAARAQATTYHVGPGQEYEQLEPLMRDVLQAGDVVEVAGDFTYEGDLVMWGGNWPGAASGTAEAPVTLRGIRKNGKRPVIRALSEWGIVLYMNHTVFEGFEVEGGTMAAIVHKADHVTVRDVLVRDCPAQGILGTDGESGSLTLEYVEVTRCGEGLYHHSIYVAGDEAMYPGHVFRMQHCFVHDGYGGNSVKSRAQRNEIYYNWIEGAAYHELDLIGPVDPAVEGLAREDSDVVGNVLIKSHGNAYGCLRAGGDGNLSSDGRYRFVNNTCILASESTAPFFLQYGIESLELDNNVIVGGATTTHLAVTVDGADPAIAGHANFLSPQIMLETSGGVPVTLDGTIVGADPGFTDLATFDLRPRADSPLIDLGVDPIPEWSEHPFPSPLVRPEYLPPPRRLDDAEQPHPRPVVGSLDLGALEYGSPEPPAAGGNYPGSGGGLGDGGDGEADTGCSFVPRSTSEGAPGLLAFALALALGRGRRLITKRV